MGGLDSHFKRRVAMFELFLEAESFEEKGGWVVDTLSFEKLHSAYLMAHGMGKSVADASTGFVLRSSGKFSVWALTRDWTAVWGAKQSAGRYQILINGRALDTVLGTNGPDWAWQKAGSIELKEGEHTISLHDLTGFNGRVDAIYITDSAAAPSSKVSDIDEMRRRLNWKQIEQADKEYDLVVSGGGVAGVCTAISASQSGVKTLIITDRPVLGGCNSSEVRVCLGGRTKTKPYKNIGDVVRAISPVRGNPVLYAPEHFEDHRKLNALSVYGVDVKLNTAVTDVEMEGGKITAVICTDVFTGKKLRIKAKLFSDCTGDGVVARKAGAEVMYGTDSRADFGEKLAPVQGHNTVMGHSIRWLALNKGEKCDFPDIDWGLHFDEDTYLKCFCGDWEQETGFNRNMVEEIEYIRDYGLRAIYSNWAYQKHHCAEKEKYQNMDFHWVSAVGGKREGYRVKGDYILTQADLEGKTSYEDGTASITWGIDIHYPEPINAEQFGEAFRSFAYHINTPVLCAVPYRCLYSKDVDNLFLGGRLVSASHVAFSAVRVMRTLGMLGEVVGLASKICTQESCSPREVYSKYLDKLKALMEQGVEIKDDFGWIAVGGTEEKWHFKDIGWFHIDSGKRSDTDNVADEAAAVKKFKRCIEEIGIEHTSEMPEKWR